ncbi:MAG: GTP-binding protein Era [Saprospiraceae bacterium]|jgi:GTP-binding protein Era
MAEKAHKSGYVNIVGRPNVGKSTLMNALVGEKMSIITNKPQTTRHRIIGILSSDDFQVVFSDTPGIISDPSYKMQFAMNNMVNTTFHDSDLTLFVTDANERFEEDDPIIERLKKVDTPLFLVINKIDSVKPEQVLQLIKLWNSRLKFTEIVPISALKKMNTQKVSDLILENLQEGPPYYPKDQLTDKPERFFVSEIVREKILELYHQEIPYSTEVIINAFKEGETSRGEAITRIDATIYVMRKSQKPILIGKGGSAIKRLGTESRKSLEKWLDTRVHLELHVKISDDWRDNERMLKHFGYK